MTPERSPFLLDLRAVGLFRVLLALTILWDQLIRLADWPAFHSVIGLVSPADSRAWENPWLWSVYWLSDGPLLPVVLEGLRFAATLTLLLGIRSRLSAFVLFVLLASIAARSPLLLQGGDWLLIPMTFFALFLPLGERGSLERLWFGTRPDSTRYRSAATVAYSVQVLLVWFMGGLLKTGEQWWGTGTAISMALHLEAFASEFARLWRGWDWLVQPMTYFVFWLECLAPLLALTPVNRIRMLGLLALMALETGIWLSLEVGLFPLISLVSLVPLLPPPIRGRGGRIACAPGKPPGVRPRALLRPARRESAGVRARDRRLCGGVVRRDGDRFPPREPLAWRQAIPVSAGGGPAPAAHTAPTLRAPRAPLASGAVATARVAPRRGSRTRGAGAVPEPRAAAHRRATREGQSLLRSGLGGLPPVRPGAQSVFPDRRLTPRRRQRPEAVPGSPAARVLRTFRLPYSSFRPSAR